MGKWYSLEGEMFFLQREVILRDLQISHLSSCGVAWPWSGQHARYCAVLHCTVQYSTVLQPSTVCALLGLACPQAGDLPLCLIRRLILFRFVIVITITNM